jgi:hypothetical protein
MELKRTSFVSIRQPLHAKNKKVAMVMHCAACGLDSKVQVSNMLAKDYV